MSCTMTVAGEFPGAGMTNPELLLLFCGNAATIGGAGIAGFGTSFFGVVVMGGSEVTVGGLLLAGVGWGIIGAGLAGLAKFGSGGTEGVMGAAVPIVGGGGS